MDIIVAKILITIIIGLITYLIIKQIFRCKQAFEFWDKRGIKTPKPLLFFGNILEMFFGDKVETDKKWRQELGKNYGVYEGTKPRLIIGDPEIIQRICVKDFDVFPNTDLESKSNNIFGTTLICLKDDHWRRVRALMSPTFSTGKIRRMFQILDGCCNDLIKTIESLLQNADPQEGLLIDGKDISCLFSIDTICSCCYGIKLKRTNCKSIKEAAKRDEVILAGLKAFDFSIIGFIGRALLPEFICNVLNIDPFPTKYQEPIQNIIKTIIDKRRQIPPESRPNDYLQSLIDARLNPAVENQVKDEDSNITESDDFIDYRPKLVSQIIDKSSNIKTSEIKLSDQEMFSQAVILLLAGLETTSNLLANCFHVLAHNSETIQDRLYKEVAKLALSKSPEYTFDYDALMGCQYLDCFIHETNRYMSIPVDISRVANREYHIEKLGFSIPEGTIVDMAVKQVAFDPEYWPEPEKFDPERFMPNRRLLIVPGSYAPWGLGPRQCLGMRFAITETKLLLAKLLMRYKFEPAPGTTWPGRSKFYMAFLKLEDPTVRINPRESD